MCVLFVCSSVCSLVCLFLFESLCVSSVVWLFARCLFVCLLAYVLVS